MCTNNNSIQFNLIRCIGIRINKRKFGSNRFFLVWQNQDRVDVYFSSLRI